MADLIVSSAVDTFMQAADQAAMRAALAIPLQVPAWTREVGTATPAAGNFSSDNANPSAVTTLYFNKIGTNTTAEANVGFGLVGLGQSDVIFLVGPDGVAISFELNTHAITDGTIITMTVTGRTNATSFPAGVYTVATFSVSPVPAADNTYANPTSITTFKGIITAIS